MAPTSEPGGCQSLTPGFSQVSANVLELCSLYDIARFYFSQWQLCGFCMEAALESGVMGHVLSETRSPVQSAPSFGERPFSELGKQFFVCQVRFVSSLWGWFCEPGHLEEDVLPFIRVEADIRCVGGSVEYFTCVSSGNLKQYK